MGRPSHFEEILLPFSAFVKFQVALLTLQLTNKQSLYFHCINNICTLTAMKKKLIRIPELASLTLCWLYKTLTVITLIKTFCIIYHDTTHARKLLRSHSQLHKHGRTSTAKVAKTHSRSERERAAEKKDGKAESDQLSDGGNVPRPSHLVEKELKRKRKKK